MKIRKKKMGFVSISPYVRRGKAGGVPRQYPSGPPRTVRRPGVERRRSGGRGVPMTKSGDYPDPYLKVGIKDPVIRTPLPPCLPPPRPPPFMRRSYKGGFRNFLSATDSFAHIQKRAPEAWPRLYRRRAPGTVIEERHVNPTALERKMNRIVLTSTLGGIHPRFGIMLRPTVFHPPPHPQTPPTATLGTAAPYSNVGEKRSRRQCPRRGVQLLGGVGGEAHNIAQWGWGVGRNIIPNRAKHIRNNVIIWDPHVAGAPKPPPILGK